jgi:hypothetical protein
MSKLVNYKVRIRVGERGLLTVSRRATSAQAARKAVERDHPGQEVVRVWRSEYAR